MCGLVSVLNGSNGGHTNAITALAPMSGSNVLFASGSADNTIKVWRVSLGEGQNGNVSLLQTFVGHSNWISTLLSLGNGLLASGSWDSTVKVWQIGVDQTLATFLGHTNQVTGLSLAGNTSLASVSADGTMRLWTIPTPESSIKCSLGE
jgi:WD40 repeat protein